MSILLKLCQVKEHDTKLKFSSFFGAQLNLGRRVINRKCIIKELSLEFSLGELIRMSKIDSILEQ